MHLKKRLSTTGLIALIATELIPIAFLCFGTWLLLHGMLFNLAVALIFFLVPLSTIFLLAFLFLSDIKRFNKGFFAIVTLLVFPLILFIITIFSKLEFLTICEGQQAQSAYQTEYAYRQLHDYTQIGSPQQVHYYDYESVYGLLFGCETDTLLCKYSPEAYASQIALIEDTYQFQTASMTAHNHTCPPTAQIDGFMFRTLIVGDNYPHEMIFIATNDQTHEIAYLSYWDQDMDYIDDLEAFIQYDCGWKHIR